MPKLRVLKERTTENMDSPNLRGFGDPELFQKSGIDTHLLITNLSGSESDASWSELCEAYNLRIETQHGLSRTRFGGTVLEVSRPILGEHQTETIRLFVAAMEILRTHPQTRCILFQTSGLRKIIGVRTGGTKNALAHEAERALDGAFEKDSKISLSDTVAMTVQRAGLIEATNPTGWTHLHEQDLEKTHKRLTGEHGNEAGGPNALRKKQVG